MYTPNFNAAPLRIAVNDSYICNSEIQLTIMQLVSASPRGIQMTCYVYLSYNDTGELLPGPNGTNEMFAKSLFKALKRSPGASDSHAKLRVHYYVAKDQFAQLALNSNSDLSISN